MTNKELELLSWMHDFYLKCKKLETRFYEQQSSETIKLLKEEYSILKKQIVDKNRQVQKLKHGNDFPDDGFLNLCIANISESVAFGFTERTNSNDMNKLINAIKEVNYKISRDMSGYSALYPFSI